MQLFEQDLFTLNDDINRYLPFDVKNPHFPDATITVKMLLTHSSSICKEHIFHPLGMTKTTWLFSETPRDEVAVPYLDKNSPAAANPYYTFPTYPDGHLTTTIKDFSKFLRAYTNGGTFNGYQLLKPETIALMFQPHFVSEGSFKYQGLIFYREETGGRTVWAHGGGDWGTSTDLIIDNKNNTGCIIFNNRWPCYSETIRCALIQYADR